MTCIRLCSVASAGFAAHIRIVQLGRGAVIVDLIKTGKQEEFAVPAMNPKWLPRMFRSSPFIKSIGRNHTALVVERLGKSCPLSTVSAFDFDALIWPTSIL